VRTVTTPGCAPVTVAARVGAAAGPLRGQFMPAGP
jgi:hypothetical protein